MPNLISPVKTGSWTGQDKLQALVIFSVLNTKMELSRSLSSSLQWLQQYFLEERIGNQNCVWGKKWTERKQTLPHYPTIKLLLNGSIAQASHEANSHVHNTSVKGYRIQFVSSPTLTLHNAVPGISLPISSFSALNKVIMHWPCILQNQNHPLAFCCTFFPWNLQTRGKYWECVTPDGL